VTRRGSTLVRWIVIVAVLVALLAGASVGGLLWYRSSVARVPRVTGLSPEAAKTQLSQAGLRVVVSHAETVGPEVPAGAIASQEPAAGKTVGRGSQVRIVVNGLEQVKIPSVEGKSQAEAFSALQDAGLWIGTVGQVFNDRPAGTVISQEPSGTTIAAKRTPVALTLSKGLRPSLVPGVVGQMEASATAALARAGYKVKALRRQDSTVPTGAIAVQSPLAGAALAKGQTVTVVVTRGLRSVRVPTVLGNGIADAVAKIQAAGLKVKIEFTRSTMNHLYGVTKSGLSGMDVAPGDTVRVQIGLGGL
jgi:serine/threonine-protein kinase